MALSPRCRASLVDLLTMEGLRGPVVALQSEHFADDAPPWLALDMDDEVNRFSDLRFHVGDRGLSVRTHDKIGEAGKSLGRRVGMDGGERTSVTGIEGIEQRPRLDSAYFAKDDPIRSP